MYRLFTPILFLTLFYQESVGQQLVKSVYQDSFQLTCARVEEKAIIIDGRLNEPIWQTAQKANNFHTKWPRAGEAALQKTEVQIATDGKFLYMAATCTHTDGKYIIQNLKRDADYWRSEGLALILDPTNQSQKGYFFGVNQLGAQTEGIFTGDGEDDDVFTWDNKWYSEVHTEGNTWYVEMAIPFAILRFRADGAPWGINFVRNDPTNGFWHTWTNIPLNFNGIDLGYAGKLVFAEGATPKKAKQNLNISPYVSSGVNQALAPERTTNSVFNYGVDAKVGIGSGLNLDLTFQPDFSQVEVDEQVVNLTRFDIGLPEKRTFFLENADIFASFGIPPIRPFFSRRIGLDADGTPQPIQFGARLTGALDTKTQLGVLHMQTKQGDAYASQMFSSVAARRVLFGRTTVGGYVHNRQATKDSRDYTRNAGAELLLNTPDGQWASWAGYHHSLQPKIKNKAAWGNCGGGYFGERFDAFIDYINIGENYRADMGFEARIENYDEALDTTLRIGYQIIYSEGNLRFPAKRPTSKLNISELGYESATFLNPDGSPNEQSNSVSYTLRWKNTMSFTASANRQESWVPVAFRFDNKSNQECPPLPAGNYAFVSGRIEWASDNRKLLSTELAIESGEFYNGTIKRAEASLVYRLQPYGKLTLSAQYNDLDFPAPYCDVQVLNITPRVEVFINRNLNWTVFMQYNDQANQFNLNSRIQWRFRPMSDLFIVYTSNAVATTRVTEARGLVGKVNWWF
jgi:hypothetical protein